MNAPCRVALLTRGAAVLVARPFDERLKRARLRLAPPPWNSVVTCCHA